MRAYHTTIFVPVVTLLALLGCATTSHGNLVRSADRLERSADALAQDDRFGRDFSNGSYSREARELADQAHDFRRTVEAPRADGRDRDLDAAFESLSHTYHALRDDVDRADSREAQRELQPVTDAYLDMEREMGGYRASDRYARDRHSYER
jgi:hypothetical protein